MTVPLVRRGEAIEYEPVDAADGLSKGVLIDDDHGAPNFAIRRFVLEPGAEVPKHTNDVEHEQYVLEGEYTVGISDAPKAHRADGDSAEQSRGNSASSRPLDDEVVQDSADRSSGRRPREEAVDGDDEHEVEAGDSLLIPAGTVHWYRNEGDEPGAFICAVPNGDDEINLLE
ncbi:cupin [Natrinema sp. CBA1119]|nr:cupin domain-containing protein [Natrinema sp. CBA1119]PGF18253.1 cupin [Natrinema sp. CBA1119]